MENGQPLTDDILLRVCVCLRIKQAPKHTEGTVGTHTLFDTHFYWSIVAVLAQNKYRLAAFLASWPKCWLATSTQTRLKQRSIAPTSSSPSWNDMALRTCAALGVSMSHCSCGFIHVSYMFHNLWFPEILWVYHGLPSKNGDSKNGDT